MSAIANDPSHAHLPYSHALNIAQARFGPAVVLSIDDQPLAFRLYDPTTGQHQRGVSWRSTLSAAGLICEQRAGMGFHFCVRPPLHAGACRCHCGTTFTPPF